MSLLSPLLLLLLLMLLGLPLLLPFCPLPLPCLVLRPRLRCLLALCSSCSRQKHQSLIDNGLGHLEQMKLDLLKLSEEFPPVH